MVSKYLSLAEAKGIGWPPPPDVDPAKLSEVLMPARAVPGRFVEPDYGEMHKELKRKGVTLQSVVVGVRGDPWRAGLAL